MELQLSPFSRGYKIQKQRLIPLILIRTTHIFLKQKRKPLRIHRGPSTTRKIRNTLETKPITTQQPSKESPARENITGNQLGADATIPAKLIGCSMISKQRRRRTQKGAQRRSLPPESTETIKKP